MAKTYFVKLLLVLWLGIVIGQPTDEFGSLVNDKDLSINEDSLSTLMRIIPSGYSPHKIKDEQIIEPSDFLDLSDELKTLNNEIFGEFLGHVSKGYTKIGLTFNIYDDNMREAAISLFRLLLRLSPENITLFTNWAIKVINSDMFLYSWRLASLYGSNIERQDILPPFETNPNYFVTSDAIHKAVLVKLSEGFFQPEEAEINQYFRIDDNIYFNVNYSGWDYMDKECGEELDYFREDVGLNSYYYGKHLLHPFWMSNAELDEVNPRHAEHYYYSHQQLMARYALEQAHLTVATEDKKCVNTYSPCLTYSNGIPFPTRRQENKEWNEVKSYLTRLDIAMKECIKRGFIIMDNGIKILMTEENHTDVISKLIRANLDGVKGAKLVRSYYGSGITTMQSIDTYNSAPSILHHPETALRDPLYWKLIQYLLNYFSEYKNSMVPFDLSTYETDNFSILEAEIPKLVTYFSHFEFNMGQALGENKNNYIASRIKYLARQKRLNHIPFTFDFAVESKTNSSGIVRLFLGPECKDDCWNLYSYFYELDTFRYEFIEGVNIISWSPKLSQQLSDDYPPNYNMFKFPKRLVIPRGLETGLNLTLFLMITPEEDWFESNYNQNITGYDKVSYKVDNKPLGFPFHRIGKGYNSSASNYKFFDLIVSHKKTSEDSTSYFSPDLH